MTWLSDDVRQAVRTLARSPGFVAATVVTLGLGMGATTTMYGVVDGIVLRSLAYPESERLVQVGLMFG